MHIRSYHASCSAAGTRAAPRTTAERSPTAGTAAAVHGLLSGERFFSIDLVVAAAGRANLADAAPLAAAAEIEIMKRM